MTDEAEKRVRKMLKEKTPSMPEMLAEFFKTEEKYGEAFVRPLAPGEKPPKRTGWSGEEV